MEGKIKKKNDNRKEGIILRREKDQKKKNRNKELGIIK